MSKSTAIIFIMGFALLFKLEKKVLIKFKCLKFKIDFLTFILSALDSPCGCCDDIRWPSHVYVSGNYPLMVIYCLYLTFLIFNTGYSVQSWRILNGYVCLIPKVSIF